MEKNSYIRAIKKLGACEEAVKDAHNFKTSEELWLACERGDWMLWLIGRTIQRSDEVALRKLTLVKARCAKLVIHLMKDERSKKAVEAAERFGLGQATREELDSASADSAAAASAAAASAASAAAAAAAASAASAAAYAAAAYAAAAYAAAASAAAYERAKIFKQCADIVRAEYLNVDDLFEEKE
jgi:chemotaxis protein histidine kinase CheA